METTCWIMKEEHCQLVPGKNCALSSPYSYEQSQDCKRVIDANACFESMEESETTFDRYCQDLDNLGFGVDDIFFSSPNENDNCAHEFSVNRKPTKDILDMACQQQQQKNVIKNEPLDTNMTNAYFCQQSGHVQQREQRPNMLRLDTACSPTSDLGSSCSASPAMDLESPGSVASSLCSSNSVQENFGQNPCNGDVGFEIYHDLIMRHLIQDIQATCLRLTIPQDPKSWTACDTRAWLMDMSAQYHLSQVPYEKLCVDGSTLCSMSLGQFSQCFPNGGETLHAQLQIWNSANDYCNRQQNANQSPMNPMLVHGNSSTDGMLVLSNGQLVQSPSHVALMQSPSKNMDDMFNYQFQQHGYGSNAFQQQNIATPPYSLSALLPSPGSCSDSGLSADVDFQASPLVAECTNLSNMSSTNNNNNIHLWQFLRELLDQHEKYSQCLRWIDHTAGIFKIEDSHKLARLWGQRKNRPAMNYDKLSRSLRQYYKKNILKKTTRSQRLVYQFLHPYHMC